MALPSLRAGLTGGGGSVIGEAFSVAAVVVWIARGRSEAVALSFVNFSVLSVLFVGRPSDDGAELSIYGFACEKSNVMLKSRKDRAKKSNMVFKSRLSFASMIASRWGFTFNIDAATEEA